MKHTKGADGKWQLEWIDKDAEFGPLFRIGPDVYQRSRANGRVIVLDAILSPGLDYLDAAVEGFREMAEHWRAPIIFVIKPDVSKPPAARFLYAWSQEAFHNGSVERTYFLATNTFNRILAQFVARAFTSDMPTIAVNGEGELNQALDTFDLGVDRPEFTLKSRALVPLGESRQGAFEQLFQRLLKRILSRE